MALVSFPYTLTAGQPENVNNLNANLTALLNGVNNIDAANITDGSVGLAELSSAVVDLLAPIGALLDYSGASDPVAGKWVLADGRALSRSTYASLFTVLGGASSPYGLPDGSTFNIPDLRGRVALGADTMNSAANRVTTNGARGNTGGVNTYQLTANDLPAHQHPYSNSVTVSGTTGGDSWNGGGSGITQYNVAVQPLFNVYIGTGSTLMSYTGHTHSFSGTGSFSGNTNNNTTSNNTLDNKPLYQVTTKIIRIA
jgi:microcystin-dependent protein